MLTHADVRGVHAHLIDLSAAALGQSVRALGSIENLGLRATAHQATYEDGLLALPADDAHPTLLAFLGSNIGNFDPPGASAFLGLMRAAVRPGDYLLLGADLVKPERDLQLAYDDPLGLTAAFNKNLLLRMNAELAADFDLGRFAHRAIWNREASRVEMHLVSLADQEVHVADADFRFRLQDGETIWTESSYKYEPAGIRALVEPGGFHSAESVDRRGRALCADSVRGRLNPRRCGLASRIRRRVSRGRSGRRGHRRWPEGQRPDPRGGRARAGRRRVPVPGAACRRRLCSGRARR